MRFNKKKDLIFVPFQNDEDLTREAFEILEAANATVDRFLTTKAKFREEMKYAAFWRYLWVLCHGGDGTAQLYGTGDRTGTTCSAIADTLIEWGLKDGMTILLWSCYGGKAGGAAQALWLNLKDRLPRTRVGGLKGITGSVNGLGMQVVSRASYNFRHGAKGDESTRAMLRDEDIVFYPGAPTRSFEI